jgi:Flp pilus assembly protein TadD
MSDDANDDIRRALMAHRQGDGQAALGFAQAALARSPGNSAVAGLLGMLLCGAGRVEEGIGHLRTALEHAPQDIGVRANLATALLSTGAVGEAAALCSLQWAEADPSMRLWRSRAHATQQLGELREAEQAYARVVATVPQDFESWNNLGNVRGTLGEMDGAVQALQRAAALRPDMIEVALNLGAALGAASRAEEAIPVLRRCVRIDPTDARAHRNLGHWLSFLDQDDEARDALVMAAELSPDDPELWLAAGVAQMKLVESEKAETMLRRSITLQPDHAEAHLQLGLLLEVHNRIADLETLLSHARDHAVDGDTVDFIEALLLRRRRDHAGAMAIVQRIPQEIEPARIAQMKGELFDRMGDPDNAFAAFTEMNRLMAESPSRPRDRAVRYRDDVRVTTRLTTPQWVAGWRRLKPSTERPAPVFLVGFPRSGTTLLDTLLMGHPAIRVLEERPPLRLTETALGPLTRLATIDQQGLDALRARYFAEVDAILPYEPGTILVDKFPLHMNKVPLIHRLFPDARIIIAERHPCDVVLSCFITSFTLNYAMSNFLDLRDTAQLYDLSFTCWEGACDAMPLNVLPIRYERILDDREAELRRAIEFVGLPWDAGMLDHENTALTRGNVRTASYSQVTEPIYDRANGRWRRYRQYLEPVLPILEPRATKMGYVL